MNIKKPTVHCCMRHIAISLQICHPIRLNSQIKHLVNLLKVRGDQRWLKVTQKSLTVT